MKKAFLLAFILLFSALFLSACSQKELALGNRANNSSVSPLALSQSDRNRRPDFGQPERPADIRGVVKSVVSNEVSILKIDPTSLRQQASSSPESKTTQDATKTGANISLGFGAGGRIMAGGPPGGSTGARPGDGSEGRAQMLAKLKELSTGEDKVIIPVGIKMLKFDRSNKQKTAVEASLVDISTDKSLTIWLNPAITDKKVAEFVLIN